MQDRISRWMQAAGRARQAGQGLVEYGLLLVFIAVVAVASLAALGTSVSSLFSVGRAMF